jgi:hypothetical protein
MSDNPFIVNGMPPTVVAAPSEAGDKIIRYSIVISRTVLVYATDVPTAEARALQVDGVAGRYTVVSVDLAPFELEPRVPIIDRASSREAQK